MNQYEAMFLFDPTFAAQFENCEGEIRRLMERAQAEVLFLRRWDDRRLTYKIKGRRRGVYVLVYFKAPADRIAPMERDAQISEQILRLLVLRADHLTPELMEKAATSRGEEAAAAADSTHMRRSGAGVPGDVDPGFEGRPPRPSRRSSGEGAGRARAQT